MCNGCLRPLDAWPWNCCSTTLSCMVSEVPLGFHLRCCGLRPLSRKKDRVITNASSQLVIFKTLTHFSTCCSQMCWTSC
ncbi:uncharacterized protein LOC144304165 isoform X4 [Canis aureus]